jgi:hypothetical protein
MAKPKQASNNIVINGDINGIKWDAQAISVLQTVATGFLQNAIGLQKLASILLSSNITMETLIKLESGSANITGNILNNK